MYLIKKTWVKGFTLVELLVVVIILAVISSIVLPRITDFDNSSKTAALDTTLHQLRKAIDRYYHDHNGVYPGGNNWEFGLPTVTPVRNDFFYQLAGYTSITGATVPIKDSAHSFGPYLSKKSDVLPVNPIDNIDTISLSVSGNLSDVGNLSGGWWFSTRTGKLRANTNGYQNR